MFKWMARKIQSKATAVQLDEVVSWTRKLSFLDSQDIASIVAMTAHTRNRMLMEKGIDLLIPHLAVHQNPYIALHLASTIKELQKEHKEVVASGVYPWLFTVRACFELELLGSTRALWGQLERGFSSAETAAESLEGIFGMRLIVDDAVRFPDGFTPNPL